MALTIGIVGLPNVGKSTVLNALTDAQNAEVANYPFCTIQPNHAVVAVPDRRVDRLAELVHPISVHHATIEFVDIAGLVSGASRGEGLGNQFLGNIRETDAIVHVVRCFDDENVVHVNPTLDPIADIEIINLELILADLEQLERKLERLVREVKGDKKLIPVMEVGRQLRGMLESGLPVSAYPQPENDAFRALNREMRFLSGKPVIYAANVDEESLAHGNDYTQQVHSFAAEHGAEALLICAQLEMELIDLNAEERRAFLEMAGATESGLQQLIRRGYHLLKLISYFTTDSRLLRAWTIHQGWTAPMAAGVIHTDFERGFIRAEVIHWADFERCGSEAAAKAAGLLHIQGKEYVVEDGDVVHFRFNV